MDTNKRSEFIYKCLKNPELLNELKKNPKKVIERELDIKLPENYHLQILEETPEKGYLVIPSLEMTKDFSEEELKAISGGSAICHSITCGIPIKF